MKQYILVAGVDYMFPSVPVNFKLYCQHREQIIIGQNSAKEELLFTTFDFLSGNVTQDHVTYSKGVKSVATSTLSTATPIDKKTMYDPPAQSAPGMPRNHEWRFKDQPAATLSVVDVYQAAQAIGSGSNPNTLAELSFFSHGAWPGPVLVNSFARPDFVWRIVNDKDPRSTMDFNAINMDDKHKTNFQNAFTKEGIVWCWGCDVAGSVKTLLHEVINNNNYSPSGVKDDTVFVLADSPSEPISPLIRNVVTALAGGGDISNYMTFDSKRNTVTMIFQNIRAVFSLIVQNTYPYVLTNNINVTTYAALPGCASSFEPWTSTSLMKVAASYGSYCTFYKNYLGIGLDPTGRRYGVITTQT